MENSVRAKFVSSLEKIFVDGSFDEYPRLDRVSALRGERLSLQLLYAMEPGDSYRSPEYHTPRISGALAKYATVRDVKQLPLYKYDGDYSKPSLKEYLRLPPGLFPDPLTPLIAGNIFGINDHLIDSLWIDIEIPQDMEAGEYTLDLAIDHVQGIVCVGKGEAVEVGRASVNIEVIGATLPEQTLKHTEWFYCDCLAQYYNVPVWSERHWEIIENFARTAKNNGINMLLTPVFTPPLDTGVGNERLTTQLVDIKKSGNRYSFGWKKLDRWIDMCDRVGIKYFEISHLFSQWGASNAPKIMATEMGEYKRIFGWETDAHSEEYKKFIRSFLRALLKHMKARGDDQRCFFHISDEPRKDQLPSYKKSKRIVQNILKDYTIMDALSDVSFFKKGVTETPIPTSWHIKDFIDEGIENPWVYYCGGGPGGYSNRAHAKYSANNRSLGMQMYKFGVVGFLHWGYNFYNTKCSLDSLNPLLDPSGGKWVPAGDTCLVYPAQDGTALESIRIIVFNEGLQDMRAMQLCESLYSKDEVVSAIEEILGKALDFSVCAPDAATMLKIREKINSMIKEKVAK